MKCCGKSKILESRHKNGEVHRKRRCLNCGREWGTREIDEIEYDFLVGNYQTLTELAGLIRGLAQQIDRS